MNSCLFCKIKDREIPAEVIYEDDHALCFLDIHPCAPGHAVVIPKVHAAILAELPKEEIGPVFGAVQHVAALVRGKLGADGLTMGINEGGVSGQTVEHLHIHVMPRFQGDGGSSLHSVVNNKPMISLVEIAQKLRS